MKLFGCLQLFLNQKRLLCCLFVPPFRPQNSFIIFSNKDKRCVNQNKYAITSDTRIMAFSIFKGHKNLACLQQ